MGGNGAVSLCSWVFIMDTSKLLQTYPEKIMGGVILKTLRSMHIVFHCFSGSYSFTVSIFAEYLPLL